MDIFSVFTMLGGLAMFLFGMDVMGKGLEKQAGGKLQDILEKLSANPLKGFLLGLAVTAIIQSSSATTVMVVGFVNSGVMQLSQAISIIMGSNVGTTVTSWILSLSGIESSNFWVQLLKPSSFAPVLAFVGIVLHMAGKSDKLKDIGSILLGFSILMIGMDTMSGAVKPLAEVPAFTRLFTIFTNPVLGVIVGALLTAVIQSSSASVGILQALAATGSVTYGSAVPIIMGQNIGTCVTAMLSSVGTNKNARRAALVHLYFNIIGASIFLILFYLFKAIIGFAFVNDPVNSFGIAVIHTTFNLLATAVMLPFRKGLERLAYLTIPEDAKKEEFQLLDERLLVTPSVAVEQSRRLAVEMANLARSSMLQGMSLVEHWDDKIAQSVEEKENYIDRYEDALGTYLVKLSSHSMTMQDSHEASKLLHCIGDFERVGDHAISLLNTAREIHEKQLVFSDSAHEELSVVCGAVQEILDRTVECFYHDDVAMAQRVEPLEQVVDELVREVRTRHIQRLQSGTCTIELGFVLSDLLNSYERVADHCSNIAVAIIEVSHDSFDTHEYLSGVKAGDDADFERRFSRYRDRYQMPGDETDKREAAE